MTGKIGIHNQLLSLDKINVWAMETRELAPYIFGLVCLYACMHACACVCARVREFKGERV